MSVGELFEPCGIKQHFFFIRWHNSVKYDDRVIMIMWPAIVIMSSQFRREARYSPNRYEHTE